MEEATSTTVHNQPKKNSKSMAKINRPLGGGGIGVGILILGGAVAAAAFLFNQRRRNKKGSSQPAKVIQDKYINEDKGLRFVATNSSANSDKDQDQDHQNMRNETSSNGMHDQKQNGGTMVSDEPSFFKQDEKGKGKLEVNGKNEDLLFNSPQLMDHILQLDPPSREREFQMAIPEESKTLLQLIIPENELAKQEIACVNGQDMQVNIRGEEIKVNSLELLPTISEIEEEVSFQPMTDKISMSNGCKENAQEIQAADVGNNDEDEELNAANEEQGKGEEDTPCTKSCAGNEDNEEHQTHFTDRSNGIKSEALEVTDKFQIPEEEENLSHLLISEALGVAQEVIIRGEEESEMSGEQIHETRDKAELHDVDTIETSPKCFHDDKSMESNVNVPEFDADNEFKEIQQPAEISELSEAGFECRVVEIADSPIQLNDEDRRILRTTEERRLTRLEVDESVTSDKVGESSEGTDLSTESNGKLILPADSIQCQSTELEKTEAIVPLANEEENGDDIPTKEMRLQNWNDEKGNSKLTVLEKYTVQLGELALEATHPQKRRMLVLTIMASSGSLCLYFGMDFLQICLIFILSMMLFEILSG